MRDASGPAYRHARRGHSIDFCVCGCHIRRRLSNRCEMPEVHGVACAGLFHSHWLVAQSLAAWPQSPKRCQHALRRSPSNALPEAVSCWALGRLPYAAVLVPLDCANKAASRVSCLVTKWVAGFLASGILQAAREHCCKVHCFRRSRGVNLVPKYPLLFTSSSDPIGQCVQCSKCCKEWHRCMHSDGW